MMQRLTAYVAGKVQKTCNEARVVTIAEHFSRRIKELQAMLKGMKRQRL